jgi:hypothetical protein
MTEERDSRDSQGENADGAGERDGRANQGDGEPVRRDLGAGHPLSPGSDESDGAAADAETGQYDGDGGTDARRGADVRQEMAAGGPAGVPGPAEQGDESGFSRRDLLLGGVGGAVAASLGWVGVLSRSGGGPGGAEAVAADYVDALADNDWERAGGLFHEDARFRQEADSYEAFLEDTGQLEGFNSLEPSVEDQFVRFHIPDMASAIEDGEEPSLGGDIDPSTVEEWKQIQLIASARTENIAGIGNASDYLADTATLSFNISLVLAEGNWQITQSFGVPGFF